MHVQINQRHASQLQIAKALACAHARTHRLPEHARADSAHTRTPNKGGFGPHLTPVGHARGLRLFTQIDSISL